MSVEIEERISGELLESTTKEMLKESKISYSKAFMLSLSDLQICKQLPKDFDRSVLREFDGACEPKPGMLPTPPILQLHASTNSHNRSVPIIRCDLVADSRGSCGRLEKQFSQSSRESISQQSCDSDSRAQKDSVGILGSILSKSKNPYRPPHSYKVGNYISDASHTFEETKSVANTACTAQEDVLLPKIDPQDDILGAECSSKQIAIQKAVDKFVDEEKSLCKAPYSFNAAPVAVAQREEYLDSDAKALTASVSLEEYVKRQFVEILEKEVSLPHTDFPDIGMRHSRSPCTAKNDIPLVNIIVEGSSENLKLNLERQETSETEISKELLSDEAFFPSEGTSFERITEINELEPYDFLTAVLSNCGAFETNGKGLRKYIFDFELEMDGIEDESAYDDYWTEILAVIHSDQDSKVTHSADKVDINDSEILPCLPDEADLISFNYQKSTEDPEIPPADTSTDSEIVEAEINWPDEDSLITLDDLISLPKYMAEGNAWKTDTADDSTDAYYSETTCDDTLMSNGTAGNTAKSISPEFAHSYKKPFLPGLKPLPSPDIPSSATHQKPRHRQTFFQTPRFTVNSEIPTLQPLDLYFTHTSFQNMVRQQNLAHCYPAVHWYPCANIHHQPPMKTIPSGEKRYEYLEQYSLSHQPDNFLQQKGVQSMSPAFPIEQVTYDVQKWYNATFS